MVTGCKHGYHHWLWFPVIQTLFDLLIPAVLCAIWRSNLWKNTVVNLKHWFCECSHSLTKTSFVIHCFTFYGCFLAAKVSYFNCAITKSLAEWNTFSSHRLSVWKQEWSPTKNGLVDACSNTCFSVWTQSMSYTRKKERERETFDLSWIMNCKWSWQESGSLLSKN